MNTAYEVKLEKFSGPLEKLLDLIEERKLEISEISLAEATGDFLDFVKKFETVDSRILSDFVAVAAKLVLIKSKILLPGLELTQEEETEIKDLETRLKIYREFKAVSQYIKNLWDRKTAAYSRPLFMALGEGEGIFYPPRGLRMEDLVRVLSNLAQTLSELFDEPKKIKTTVVSLEQKMNELLARFEKAVRQSFGELTKKRPRGEIIVLFLAILHLLRDQVIKAEQKGQFGDIIIQKHES
jgi:segregation and condensation protein A